MEYASDLSRYKEWLTIHRVWRSKPPDTLEKGAVVESIVEVKGMPNRVKWTIVHYKPPEAMSLNGDGITRLTAYAAPDWEYPPDGHTGVHRVVIEGEPRVELNMHVSDPVLDVTEAGCVSTTARVVNAIDWICRAPKGLISVADIPQAEVIRGLMW
jgi:hypothetical protein